MRKGPGSAYDKWNISVVICDTDITTHTDRSASYLDMQLAIDDEGRLGRKHYDKRDDFNFSIVIFPFICSNIPAAPAYGVHIYPW
jgi:hypothetical protein